MACTTTIISITTSCGSNLASIKKLWIGAFESAIFSFNYQMTNDEEVLDADGNPIIESVETAVLGSGADKWVEFGFKKNTGEMTSEMTRSDNGTYYFSNGCNLVFAKQDQSKRLALQSTASGECSMVILDSNGIYWLIGANDAVTATSLSATTGVSVGDNNQYTITLSADEAILPIPLAADKAKTIIDTLTGVTPGA
jgi:hypothetical protein